MTVADRIKYRRIELGMSQEELATKAGYCGKPIISRFEHSGNDISMKQIKRLSEALECTMAYLMGWETDHDQVEEKKHEEKPTTGSYVNTDDIPKAIDLYTQYINAPQEVRVAVELLLKSQQSDALHQRLQSYTDEQTNQDS